MTFNRLRKFLLIFIGALIGICFYISFSYAYYTGNASVGSSTGASASAEGDIVLIDNTAITLTGDKAVPISDSKALSSTNYRNQFQIRNDKKSTVNVDVYMVPTMSTTMNSSAVKYALYDSTAAKPTSGTNLVSLPYALSDAQKSYATAKGYTPTSMGYKLGSFNLTSNQSKTLNLYLWINYQETGTDKSTYNSYFEGIIFIKITGATSDMDGTFYQMMATNAIVDSSPSSSGVYLKNDTIKDDYPILYYYGSVSNNNVLFENRCWKIVRSIEKNGGIKLIYNGIPNGTTCNNTGEATLLNSIRYNTDSNSPANVGIMQPTTPLVYYDLTISSTATTSFYFAKDVSYSSAKSNYVLNATPTSFSQQGIVSRVAMRNQIITGGYKYSFLKLGSSSRTGTTVYVAVKFLAASRLRSLALENGALLSNLRTILFANETSTELLETLFLFGDDVLRNVKNSLEDAVWCNDRHISRGPLFYKTTTSGSASAVTNFNTSSTSKSLNCTQPADRFTSLPENGNGLLDFPIGLITLPEYNLAGGANSYLVSGAAYWTMTPASYDYPNVYVISSSGESSSVTVTQTAGVRPAIALKHTTKIASGDGSASNPYRVS